MAVKDFNDDPIGRRDIMKGLTSFVGGLSFFYGSLMLDDFFQQLYKINTQGSEKLHDIGLSLGAAGLILFLGYSTKGISRIVKTEIGDLRQNG